MRRIRIRESDCPRWRSGSALSPIPLSHPFRVSEPFGLFTDGAFQHLSNLTLREIHARFVVHLDSRYVSWHAVVHFFSLFIGASTAPSAPVARFLLTSTASTPWRGWFGCSEPHPGIHPLTWICCWCCLFFFLVLCVRVCSISMRYVHNCGAHSHLSWCVHVCFCGLFNVEWLSIYRYALWDAHIIRSPSAWPLPDRDKKPNQIY